MLFAGQYSSFWIVFHFIKPANIFEKDVKLPLEGLVEILVSLLRKFLHYLNNNSILYAKYITKGRSEILGLLF